MVSDQYAEAQPVRGFTNKPVLQGDSMVSSDPAIVMTTILGSCIAACLWDPIARVGGMNHFLLPGDRHSPDGAMRYGVNSMELLVNGLIREGASRERIKARILGGAKMYSGSMDIGSENAKFAKWFIENEGFEFVDSCVGGRVGRNVRFWPTTGRVQRRFMADNFEVEERTPTLASPADGAIAPAEQTGEVDLF